MKDIPVSSSMRLLYLIIGIIGYVYSGFALLFAVFFLAIGLFPISGVLLIPIAMGFWQGKYFTNAYKIKSIPRKTKEDRERIRKSIELARRANDLQNKLIWLVVVIMCFIGLGILIFAPYLEIKVRGILMIVLALGFGFFVKWMKSRLIGDYFEQRSY